MKKLITILLAAILTYSAVGQKLTLQKDTLNSIVVKGYIKNIQILIKDWESGSKVYHIYWVEITLDMDTSSLRKLSFSLDKKTIDSIPKSLIFTSNTSGFRHDLDSFEKFEIGKTVNIQTEKIYINQFIKKERESILIDKINLL